MRTLKICIVTARFPPFIGGVEIFAHELARGLANKGFKVEVHTSTNQDAPRIQYHDRMKVIRHKTLFEFFRAPINPAISMAVIKQIDMDIVHVVSSYPGISDFAAFLGRLVKKPVVLTHQFDLKSDYSSLLGKVLEVFYLLICYRLLAGCSKVIVATTKSYSENSSLLKRVPRKVVVIPNGVNTQRFRPDVDGKWVRAILNLPKDAKVILFVGRLVPFKGLEYLIKSISILLNNCMDVFLVIVGDGELRHKLVQLTQKLRVEGNVIFTGEVPHTLLPEYYAASDIFVLPSVSSPESFGIVLVEAMASGKPVISTDIPGPREVVLDGRTGLRVPPADSMHLASAIKMLLDNDKLRREMGCNGRLLAQNKYDWKKIVDQYILLYSSVLARQSNKTSS